ncbi:MAG: hypothetical protein KGN84_01155 [Acidobacteriota bacterium]|nr:hypothetical protein [Acidobacteriota bacterium]
MEEISQNEAVLEADSPVPVGTSVALIAEKARFHGTVTFVTKHEFGWRLGVEFSPLTPWSPEIFEPGHLLDPSSLG